MQVLERVRATESLGREFLVWLWFKSEKNQGVFDLGESGKAEIWFDRRMTLQAEHDMGLESITCTGRMNYRSFKTPKVMQDKDEDPDGIFYEKMYLIEEALKAMDTIFSIFIKLRVSPEWDSEEHPALVKWINEIN